MDRHPMDLKKHVPWLTTSSIIFSFWVLRFVWRELNFPAALIGGWLFSPNLYASPFVFGLSSSLGELVFTVLAAAVSGWFVLSVTLFTLGKKEIVSRINLRIGRIASVAVIGIVSMLILWLFRGFGEAVRSFVFDSTIRYNDPSEILPDAAAAIMYFNVFARCLSVVCLDCAALWRKKTALDLLLSS